MRHLFIPILILLFNTTLAQKADTAGGYILTEVVNLPATNVKSQHRSGTCWSFSGLSFLESEVLRLKKLDVDLAEMWLVKKDYFDRAVDYVRFQGEISFGSGAESNDVMDMIELYGIVPEDVFPGLNYGTDKHVHYEMDEVLKAMVDAVIKNKNRKLSTAWKKAFYNAISSYLGEDVETFTIDGKEYTPKLYQEYLGIVPKDYVEISSFTHHPFYTEFIMEVPDNWAFGRVFNVKLEEMYQQALYALDNGYTLLWGADVSEEGFSYRDGVAIIPETDLEELADSEMLKWSELPENELMDSLYAFDKPVPEKNITQEFRQEAFENYETTDDHGMHITGYAKDNEGRVFFIVKNTWGESNDFGGYFYASESYFKYKTLSIMFHKDGLMESIQKQME